MSVCIRHQVAPIGYGGFPLLGGGRKGALGEVVDSGIVHGDQAHASTRFNRHVAHRHAAFHGERLDGAASELDGVACAACGANLADNRQHYVFCGHAQAQLAFDAHLHVFHLLRQQALSG